VQAQRDVDRLAKENSDLCDEVHGLREENERLRAELEAKR
jgi:predicted RNase H-like nuclease (RuvC/YqgF family)